MMKVAGAINDEREEGCFHLLVETFNLVRRRREADPRPPDDGVHNRQRKRFNFPRVIQVEMNR